MDCLDKVFQSMSNPPYKNRSGEGGEKLSAENTAKHQQSHIKALSNSKNNT